MSIRRAQHFPSPLARRPPWPRWGERSDFHFAPTAIPLPLSQRPAGYASPSAFRFVSLRVRTPPVPCGHGDRSMSLVRNLITDDFSPSPRLHRISGVQGGLLRLGPLRDPIQL